MIYGHFGKKASVAMKEIEARIDLYNLSHSTNAANGPPALEKVKEVLNRGESPGPPVASGQPYSHDDNQERGGGREKPETASTSEPPLKETIWTKIWSWGAVSVLDSLILAGWMTFMTSGHLQAADGFLFVGAALFLAKFWTWEEARRQSPPRKWALQATVTLVSLGLVLMAALWNHDVNRTASNNQSEQSTAGKTPAILNDPGHDAGKEISTIAPTTRKRVITTAERVKAIISQQLSVDSKQIKLEDDFEMDLGATPADVYFVMLALEQEYDIKILSSESKNLHTVGETIDYIEAREKRKQQKQAKLQNRAEP
jgi:acyl carrier protein